MLRTWGRYLYAPVMLLGFNGAAIALFSASHRFDLVRLLLLFALAVVVSFGAERWIPYEATWNRHRDERGRDRAHTLVNETIAFLSVGLIPGVTAIVRPWRGIWPHHWPLLAQVLIAVLVADVGVTLVHYLSHRWAWLWRFHLPHHATHRMYALNGFIQHPVHQAFEILLGVFPLALIGMPRRIGLLLAFAVAIQLLLQHANVGMRLGPLRYVLAVGPVHRRHHLRRFSGFGMNFGLFINLWDYLLGVADVREDDDLVAEDFGLDDHAGCPVGYVGQLGHPFVRRTAPANAEYKEFLNRSSPD